MSDESSFAKGFKMGCGALAAVAFLLLMLFCLLPILVPFSKGLQEGMREPTTTHKTR